MDMVKCLACGGVYSPVLPDGLQYFHACPPLSVVELTAAVAAAKVVLPVDPVTTLPETPAVAVTRRTYERATKRDENVTPAGALKSPGLGTTPIAAPPPVVVVV
jgi:hypothetical protein